MLANFASKNRPRIGALRFYQLIQVTGGHEVPLPWDPRARGAADRPRGRPHSPYTYHAPYMPPGAAIFDHGPPQLLKNR